MSRSNVWVSAYADWMLACNCFLPQGALLCNDVRREKMKLQAAGRTGAEGMSAVQCSVVLSLVLSVWVREGEGRTDIGLALW